LRLICLKILPIFFIICSSGQTSDRFISLADSLKSAGFYEEAITEYRRCLFFSSDNQYHGEIYACIGYCFAELNQWEKALVEMEKAIEISVGDSLKEQRCMDRTVLLIAVDRHADARIELRQIVNFSGNRASVYHARIYLRNCQGIPPYMREQVL